MVAPGDDSAARPVVSELARARDGWVSLSPHARADFDLVMALAYLHLGRLILQSRGLLYRSTPSLPAVTVARVCSLMSRSLSFMCRPPSPMPSA